MAITEERDMKVGDTVRFRESDSQFIHTGVIESIDTVPAQNVYSPARKVYWVKDQAHGWMHRLSTSHIL